MQLWLQHLDDDQGEDASLHGQIWAILIAIVIFGSITLILRPRGVRVCLMACLYVASLVAIALAMCELTRRPLHYRFPGFVTLVHYLCTWAFCIGYWIWQGELEKCSPSSLGSMKLYLFRMVPIALALPISIALNNKALAHIGAGLASIVGTLSPVCTAVLSRVFGRRLTPMSWFGVLVAFGGALWAGCSELTSILQRESAASARYQIQGLSLSIGALACRSIRVVLQDSLMSPTAYGGTAGLDAQSSVALSKQKWEDASEVSSSARPAPVADVSPPANISGLHLLAIQSPAVVLVSAVFAFVTESSVAAVAELTAPIVQMLVVTCFIAVCLNVVGACILKELGSTSMQIIGKLNTIITTSVSMAFFHESLPVTVLCGSAVVLLGVAIFEVGEKNVGSVKSM